MANGEPLSKGAPKAKGFRDPFWEVSMVQCARIFHLGEITPIDRGKGVRSIPLVGSGTGAKTLLTGMSVFPPGTEIPFHTHNTEECIVLLEGHAVCEVNGTRHQLIPFDTTFVTEGTPHRFINVGDSEMRILWVYARVDTTRTFIATGETVGHMDRYDNPQE